MAELGGVAIGPPVVRIVGDDQTHFEGARVFLCRYARARRRLPRRPRPAVREADQQGGTWSFPSGSSRRAATPSRRASPFIVSVCARNRSMPRGMRYKSHESAAGAVKIHEYFRRVPHRRHDTVPAPPRRAVNAMPVGVRGGVASSVRANAAHLSTSSDHVGRAGPVARGRPVIFKWRTRSGSRSRRSERQSARGVKSSRVPPVAGGSDALRPAHPPSHHPTPPSQKRLRNCIPPASQTQAETTPPQSARMSRSGRAASGKKFNARSEACCQSHRVDSEGCRRRLRQTRPGVQGVCERAR
jgi:hypothetical protein